MRKYAPGLTRFAPTKPEKGAVMRVFRSRSFESAKFASATLSAADASSKSCGAAAFWS